MERFAEAIVRRAQPRDLDGMLALLRELRPQDAELPRASAQKIFAGLLARTDLDIIVCEVGALLAASCTLATIPNLASGGRPFGVIEHVVTLSTHRRLGYGRRVLEYALQQAWLHGCYKVMLLSGAQRTDAHRLYESVGFVRDLEYGFVAKPEVES
jgi:GNAT superfamily N-acetyltransferase